MSHEQQKYTSFSTTKKRPRELSPDTNPHPPQQQRRELINPSPVVYFTKPRSKDPPLVPDVSHKFNASDIFDVIRDIKDPEHPFTLEQLNIVNKHLVKVEEQVYGGIKDILVTVQFTPTVPHCSLASLIGLCIRTKLTRELSKNTKIIVNITPGSHNSVLELNRQLNDKERIIAALENTSLRKIVENCLKD
eukprot:TRINITY_DN10567_c0_g1_i1.p1 TRINITY_DN10567_c0_g1~~TRINITY_DN10567_c0_g1_i1.p1  ORF type:complete len:191 (+),score=34.24 TRINITY_DN10567_c0_g1_i1:71-643(+)